MKKGFNPILVLLILAIIGVVAYFFYIKPSSNKACTLEVKVCPDGSSVNRVGPNCEFAACPTTPKISPTADPTANWNTYTNNNFDFSFKYPNTGKAETLKKRDNLLLGGASFGLNYDDNEFRPQASEVYVSVYSSSKLDLETWLQTNSTTEPFGSSIEREFYGYVAIGKTELSGKPGIKFKENVMGFTAYNTAVKFNSYIYVVGYIKVADDLSKEYDQILSSFKFLE